MELKIGVLHTAKEIELDMADATEVDKLVAEVEAALGKGSGSVLWLTDRRGRKVGIPAERLAYVDIGGREDRRVGFGTH